MNEIKFNMQKEQQWKIELKQVLYIIDKIVDIFGIILAVAILLTVLIQIIGRLTGNPAPWTEEATRFLFIIMIFLGIAIGFRRCESTRVTIFISYMPPVFRKLSKHIYIFFSVGFFLFMIVYGLDLVQQQIVTNEIGSALRIPMWTVGSSVPISGILGVLGVLENVLFYPELIDA